MSPARVQYRELWGIDKRSQLLKSLQSSSPGIDYSEASPNAANRYSLRAANVSGDYVSWPAIIKLTDEEGIPGLLEMRRGTLIDIDREQLAHRMRRYFDRNLALGDLIEERSGPAFNMARFKAAQARDRLLSHENFDVANIRRYHQRPFDKVWCYHTSLRPIWNEPRPELISRADHNAGPFLISRAYRERPLEGPHLLLTTALPDYHLLRPNCSAFSFYLVDGRANLSGSARAWLEGIGLPDPDRDHTIAELPWYHSLAIGYSPAWLSENADGIRQDWPHVPLPNSPDLLRGSAALGSRLAALLDPDLPLPGVTGGTIEPALACVALPSKTGPGAMLETDRELTAGWGHAGKDGAVMPGRGRIIVRNYTPEEAATLAAATQLGTRTHDAFLNSGAYWKNIPEGVWNYTIGGYQVLKKWLSYRERPLLGRALTPAEVRYVQQVARRLAAILLMAPELDANYRSCAAAHQPLT